MSDLVFKIEELGKHSDNYPNQNERVNSSTSSATNNLASQGGVNSATTTSPSDDMQELTTILGFSFSEKHKQMTEALRAAEQLLREDNYISYEKAEQQYAAAAKFAQTNEDHAAVVDIFCKLGKIYIYYAKNPKQGDKPTDCQYLLIKAAALFNCAINILKEKLQIKDITQFEEIISAIEQDFLYISHSAKNPFPYQKVNAQHVAALQNIRKEIIERVASITNDFKSPWWEEERNLHAIQDLYADLTLKMQKFIITLWQECIATIEAPPSPCKYAMIAFGSMARGEMTPYSDFEWGILLEDSSEENKKYFRTLANLLYLKVVNLGETILPAINIKSLQGMDDYITPRGFTFDGQMSRACKTPFGKKYQHNDSYELLGTPAEMAELQKDEWLAKDRLLPSEVYQFALIYGDAELAHDYQQQMYKILDADLQITYWQQIKALFVGQTEPFVVRQSRALKLLEANLTEFPIHLQDDEGKAFQIKIDLYRLLNMVLDDLGLYYKLQADELGIKSGWDKADEMASRQLLTIEGTSNIKKALSIIVALRLCTYINNDGQREDMLARKHDVGQHHVAARNKHIFFLGDVNCLFAIYRVILPLKERLQQFLLQKSNKQSCLLDSLFAQSEYTTGCIYYRLMYYPEAIQHLEQALEIQSKLDGDGMELIKIDTLRILAEVYRTSGNVNKACALSAEALRLTNKYSSIIEPWNIAMSLRGLAMNYCLLGNYKQQKELLEQVLQIDANRYVSSEDRAMTLYSLGLAYAGLGNYEKQKELLAQAMQIYINCYGQFRMENKVYTTLLGGFANACGVLGNRQEQKKMLKKVLQIKIKYYGTRGHAQIAVTLHDLAINAHERGDYRKQKELAEEALLIYSKHSDGTFKMNVASALQTFSSACRAFGENNKAEKLLDEAVHIASNWYKTRKHIGVARPLSSLANVHIELGNLSIAIKLLEEALSIQRDYYENIKHLDVAYTLSSLARIYDLLGKYDQVIESANEALFIARNHYCTSEHIMLTNLLSSLGSAYMGLGDFHMAKKNLEEALTNIPKDYKNVDMNAIIDYNLNLVNCVLQGDDVLGKSIVEQLKPKNRALLVEAIKNGELSREKILRFISAENNSIEVTKGQVKPKDLANDQGICLQDKLKLVKKFPNDAAIHQELGDYYFVAGQGCAAIIHYEKAVELAPHEALVDHNLACCYNVRKWPGDLILATKHFEHAIKLAPKASVFCEYGHFLFQQNKLAHAIIRLRQAIGFQDNSGIYYGTLESPVIEEYLQSLVVKYKQINLEPVCLAYYLLIKTYVKLECYTELVQAFAEFDKYFNTLFKCSKNASTSLQLELLLYENTKLINKVAVFFIKTRLFSTDPCLATEQAKPMFFSFTGKRYMEYLVAHRHEDQYNQQAYDQNFGVTLERNAAIKLC